MKKKGRGRGRHLGKERIKSQTTSRRRDMGNQTRLYQEENMANRNMNAIDVG
jgi:hypothetical protein